MADPTVTIGIKEIVYAGLYGAGAFMVWLLKKSIFGRMDEQDKKIDKLQPQTMCILVQAACQKVIFEKIDATNKIMTAMIGALDEKVDTLLHRQSEVIGRIDAHINGHSHKGD